MDAKRPRHQKLPTPGRPPPPHSSTLTAAGEAGFPHLQRGNVGLSSRTPLSKGLGRTLGTVLRVIGFLWSESIPDGMRASSRGATCKARSRWGGEEHSRSSESASSVITKEGTAGRATALRPDQKYISAHPGGRPPPIELGRGHSSEIVMGRKVAAGDLNHLVERTTRRHRSLPTGLTTAASSTPHLQLSVDRHWSHRAAQSTSGAGR